jgi:hypothetical protein
MGETRTAARMAPGRAVAQERGVWSQLRATASDSGIDVLVLAAQAVGYTGGRARAGVRAGAGHR